LRLAHEFDQCLLELFDWADVDCADDRPGRAAALPQCVGSEARREQAECDRNQARSVVKCQRREEAEQKRQPEPEPGNAWPHAIPDELASSAVEPLDELLQQALLIASETGLVRDASIATSERQRAEFWKLRESVPAAQRQFGPSIKHDVSVPISQLPAFVREASARVTQLAPQDLLVCYGHVGDGSLHFNISHADDAANAAFLAREPELKRAIHELTMQYDGSISAEHGIGRLKVDELARYKSAQEMTLMRAIKQQLDPRGIMNPGKLFPR